MNVKNLIQPLSVRKKIADEAKHVKLAQMIAPPGHPKALGKKGELFGPGCRWIYGDPRLSAVQCSNTKKFGQPYCDFHFKLSRNK